MRTRVRAFSTLLVGALLVAGCTSANEQAGALEPQVKADGNNPLRAELIFAAESAPIIEVIDADDAGFRLTVPVEETNDYLVPLLGLTADTSYTVTVTAGEETASTSFTTGSLPDDFPPIEVVSSTPEDMTPGLTLFNATRLDLAGEGGPSEDGFLVAVDERGEVVWYYQQTHSAQDIRRTASGGILYIHHETGVRSLDVLDNTITEWSGTTGLDEAPEDSHGRAYAGPSAIRVETDQMHHEVIELPNGNLMTLSRETREIDGFPDAICDDEEFEGSYQVTADTVVEFVPADGSVVNEWSLFEYANPLDNVDLIRGSEFCGGYLSDVYPDLDARDWTHANAVVLDEERNALLVSVRHLDQIFAIRYEDDANGPAGELMWRLGEGGDFTLSEGEWFLRQHAPQVLPDGSIMIYDNGNERPGTSLDQPDDLPYSRAVQYEIDTEEMTARQVWEHRADSPGDAVYAPFVGDADMLGNETVLIAHGGLLDPPAHSPQTEGVVVWGRLIEVDYETGDTVFDLRLKDPDREQSWLIYRSERIPTIYPDGYTVGDMDG